MFTTILIQPLTNALVLFYKILGGNLGLAIIAFSVVLRFLLNPLTKPYMESMKKMRDFAPQIDKLKKKYKGDKIKFAQAQADFYKEKGISPQAGCLPYIIQIVILIAFFRVFTLTLSGGGDITENFNKLLYEPLKFTQGQIVNTNFLYLNLDKPDAFHIPGIPVPIPGPILLAAALVQFLSSKLMSPVIKKEAKVAKATKKEEDDIQVAMQKSMVYTFPLMTIVFGLSFPSGLAIYWFLFSLWQLLQQLGPEQKKAIRAWINSLNLVKLPEAN